jgi:hypothetical protein
MKNTRSSSWMDSSQKIVDGTCGEIERAPESVLERLKGSRYLASCRKAVLRPSWVGQWGWNSST